MQSLHRLYMLHKRSLFYARAKNSLVTYSLRMARRKGRG